MKNFVFITLTLLAPTAFGQSTAFLLSQAEDVLQANLDITGGEDRWRDVETIRWEATLSGRVDDLTLTGKRTSVCKFPGYRYVEQEILNGGVTEKYQMVYTPNRAWMNQPDGRKNLPLDQYNPALSCAKEELCILDGDEWTLERMEKTTFQNRPVYKVILSQDNAYYQYRYYDRRTLMHVATEMPMPDDTVMTTLYSDFRTKDGLILPYRITVITPQVDGRQVYDIQRIELNPDVDNKLFSDR